MKKTFYNRILYVLLLGSLLIWQKELRSQTSNLDYERVNLNTEEYDFSGIALSPNHKHMAISSKKSAPVVIMDVLSRKIIQQFNAANWSGGSKVSYSDAGNYILLQQLNYTDIIYNKDRLIDFEIIDASNGRRIILFEQVQDVLISNDEKFALSLNQDELTFWNLPDGTKGETMSLPGAVNTIALSPDGNLLAVSQEIRTADVKNRFKKDKKGLKSAVKFKQMIGIYDVKTKSKINTIYDLYDIVYNLNFSANGNILFAFHTPDMRIQLKNNKMTHIGLIGMDKMEALREGYTSMSVMQPELNFSADKTKFAINSKGSKFQEINLYDTETGTLQKRFELGNRIFQKFDGEKLTADSRPSFVFSPDNQSIVIAMGNQLIVWNLANSE